MCGTEFSTDFTATVDIEQQAAITSLKNFLVKKAGKLVSTQSIKVNHYDHV